MSWRRPAAAAARDRWNAWVFNLDVGGIWSGEAGSKSEVEQLSGQRGQAARGHTPIQTAATSASDPTSQIFNMNGTTKRSQRS
jgi:hypothetical protein